MRLPARAGTEVTPTTRTDDNARTRVAFVGFFVLFFYQSIIGAQTPSPPGTQIVNVASVTAQSVAGQISQSSNPVVTLVAAVPFSLTKSVSPLGTVQPGSSLTYTGNRTIFMVGSVAFSGTSTAATIGKQRAGSWRPRRGSGASRDARKSSETST